MPTECQVPWQTEIWKIVFLNFFKSTFNQIIAKGKENRFESLKPAQELFIDIILKLCTFFQSNFMTRCIPVEMCKKPNLKSFTGKLLDLYPQESLYVVQ